MEKKMLFEFIFDNGKGTHIKIFSDGTYEGLPPNTIVMNYLSSRVIQIMNDIRVNLS